jgi:flagellar hook assembly protein FlgD
MESSGFTVLPRFAMPVRAGRSALTALGLTGVLMISAAWSGVSAVRAAPSTPLSASSAAATRATTAQGAVPLKMVVIVAPAGSQTSADLADAEALAQLGESYGLDVRRVFFPHATWDNVMANIQGANLVAYMGHGYGWPSPYTKVLTESRQDGVGLNSFDGSSTTQFTYYGATVLRDNWVLAPNAIVWLNHDCYTSGNGEPSMAIPSWDVARQRVDNFASGFLAIGAGAVFAFEWQRFNKSLQLLMTTDDTMAQIFETPGAKPTGMWGWVGWDPRKFDSVRTPGAMNYLDPDPKDGFLRAVTGDLSMTAADWAQGQAGSDTPPALTDFTAQGAQVTVQSGGGTPMFTPNGDGVTDDLQMTYNVDKEAFVDLTVTNGGGNVVRTMSSWSRGGAGNASWDGKRDDGGYVGDGDYTITATPRDRAGNTGDPQSISVKVLTTMFRPSVSPNVFYAADNDGLAPTTTLSVTLESAATFWWKIADSNGNVVRTYINGDSTDPGDLSWQWDGRDNSGAFVPDGTYYSFTTAATSAGTYFHSLPVDVRAFRLTSAATAPFVRGTKVKFFVASAESLLKKPKVQVTFPGLVAKTYGTSINASGGYYVTVTFPTTAGAGTVTFRVIGTDTGGQKQWSDYSFDLQ